MNEVTVLLIITSSKWMEYELVLSTIHIVKSLDVIKEQCLDSINCDVLLLELIEE